MITVREFKNGFTAWLNLAADAWTRADGIENEIKNVSYVHQVYIEDNLSLTNEVLARDTSLDERVVDYHRAYINQIKKNIDDATGTIILLSDRPIDVNSPPEGFKKICLDIAVHNFYSSEKPTTDNWKTQIEGNYRDALKQIQLYNKKKKNHSTVARFQSSSRRH
jgi:hypothetical protein